MAIRERERVRHAALGFVVGYEREIRTEGQIFGDLAAADDDRMPPLRRGDRVFDQQTAAKIHQKLLFPDRATTCPAARMTARATRSVMRCERLGRVGDESHHPHYAAESRRRHGASRRSRPRSTVRSPQRSFHRDRDRPDRECVRARFRRSLRPATRRGGRLANDGFQAARCMAPRS